MSETVLKKIVGSKVGQTVLGTVAAGAVSTIGAVLVKRWVGKKLAARELLRVAAAAEKERQRILAEAETERQRLAAIAEEERQRADAKAALASQQAAKAKSRAERRAEVESRVGGVLNRTFQRLGLNLRAEVAPAAAATKTK